MALNGENYNNLLDAYLLIADDAEVAGNVPEQFKKLLVDYFFADEKKHSRNFELFLTTVDTPPFMHGLKSIVDIKVDDLKGYIRGNSINDSLAGKIMLSQQYLKAFYPHHAPSFSKLPEDVRFELMDLIREKNDSIESAFQKMLLDRDVDKQRKVITLVALILKNIHRRTGAPLNRLPKPAEELIRNAFPDSGEVFTASQKQMVNLRDDARIKQIVKAFFTVKQFKDITDIAEMFKEELERYRKRTIIAQA